jgi:hypothetical protein
MWLSLSSDKGGPALDGSREKLGERSFPERSRLGTSVIGDRIAFLEARSRRTSSAFRPSAEHCTLTSQKSRKGKRKADLFSFLGPGSGLSPGGDAASVGS